MNDRSDISERELESGEVVYDNAGDAPVSLGEAIPEEPAPPSGEGGGCHGGAAEMRRAAEMAGKSEILEQY
ncbi:MAG: chlorophyllide a reductase subunit Y, partial [Hyphococcus sp.]